MASAALSGTFRSPPLTFVCHWIFTAVSGSSLLWFLLHTQGDSFHHTGFALVTHFTLMNWNSIVLRQRPRPFTRRRLSCFSVGGGGSVGMVVNVRARGFLFGPVVVFLRGTQPVLRLLSVNSPSPQALALRSGLAYCVLQVSDTPMWWLILTGTLTDLESPRTQILGQVCEGISRAGEM